MDVDDTPVKQLLKQRMKWLGQRQEVLAKNIANADTPGYKPEDMKPTGFKQAMAKVQVVNMATTSEQHLAGVRKRDDQLATQREKNAYETTPDGNAVVLEEQMMKVAQTQMDYQTTTTLYRKFGKMIKIAIGQGGGG